jgi:simple sugar transport system permease protein
MDMILLSAIVHAILVASTPLVFAGLGALIQERAGVLNLGIEGLMIVGALAGFVVALSGQPLIVSVLAAAMAGALLASLFGFLVLRCLANPIASGLALTLFGLGLSALAGAQYVGQSAPQVAVWHIPLLSNIPFVGKAFFSHDPLVYGSILAATVVWWFLMRSRPGLVLRAVGENHDSAHALGFSVRGIRFLAILAGGGLAGIGGAYLTLIQTPLFVEGMTAGRGWIALALVVFASWRPFRVIAGAYLFGCVTIVQLHSQAFGVSIPSQILSMLPYLATILVLVFISWRSKGKGSVGPSSLGKTFKISH